MNWEQFIARVLGGLTAFLLINGALWLADSPWRFGWYRL
jgi:hypothetical protein